MRAPCIPASATLTREVGLESLQALELEIEALRLIQPRVRRHRGGKVIPCFFVEKLSLGVMGLVLVVKDKSVALRPVVLILKPCFRTFSCEDVKIVQNAGGVGDRQGFRGLPHGVKRDYGR